MKTVTRTGLVVSALVSLAAISACNTKESKPEGDKVPPPAPKAAAQSVPLAPAEPPRPKDPNAPADVAAPPADAQKTPSGLASKVLKPGTGKEHPTEEDAVEVLYSGWTKDGWLFDSSEKHGGKPARFPLGRVVKGWTEGVQLMVEGEKRRLWIPADLAYGAVPKRPGAPAGDLTFDVELIKIHPTPKAPVDVAAPPKDAKKTASGLAYKVLTKGKSKKHPAATDNVQVHYSGWTTNGKLFDSSVSRGEPASFPLNGVIPGWTEGLQLMVEGEKARFWIPANLAYGENPGPGRPAGMLVFDVELLKIQ